MTRVVIFGIGDLAKDLYAYFDEDERYEVVGFTVDREYTSETSLFEKQIVPFEDVQDIWKPDDFEMVVAIGYTRLNEARKEKILQAKEKGYKIASFIHPTAVILSDKIGEGNIFLEYANVGHYSVFGNYNIVCTGSGVGHNGVVGDYNFFAGHAAPAGFVTIGNHCFLGSHCTIKDKTKVADYTIIGAGAYISGNTKSHYVYMPPRTVKFKVEDGFDFL